MKSRVLLLEDDLSLSQTIIDYLEDEGFEAIPVYDADEAQAIIYEKKFDIFLFDVNVPVLNGFELLKLIRKQNNLTPCIFITSLNSMNNLEEGFSSGCDDYIRKPFALKELLLRVQTILKKEFSKKHTIISFYKDFTFDTRSNELKENKILVDLHYKELKLLKLFLQCEDELVSHNKIYNYLWDYDEQHSNSSLRTYIKNLRKILGKEKIVSLKKLGYRFISK